MGETFLPFAGHKFCDLRRNCYADDVPPFDGRSLRAKDGCRIGCHFGLLGILAGIDGSRSDSTPAGRSREIALLVSLFAVGSSTSRMRARSEWQMAASFRAQVKTLKAIRSPSVSSIRWPYLPFWPIWRTSSSCG